MKNKNFMKGLITGIVLMIIIGTGFFISLFLVFPGNVIISDLSLFKKILVIENLIRQEYIEDVNGDTLKEGIYTGLMYGLEDPYSVYYTKEEYEQETTSSDGAYVGIGILMQQNADGGIEIVECYEGAPGEQAGLMAKDVICAVDGMDVTDKTTSELADMIRGSKKEKVILTISREGEKSTLDIEVPISDVEIKSVFYQMLPDKIGYLRISQFTGVTAEQFKSALSDLEVQKMEKLIIDLRGNPGGLLTSVCEVLEEILPKGLIVYTEQKDGEREEYTCEGSNAIDIPMVVLVNGESASASEIFAGAVKDHKAGTIMGTTTYGKGIVQSIISLYDGSAIKMTTAKYYTPNGNDIHGKGIEPDIVVELSDHLLGQSTIEIEEDNQIQEAMKYLNK